VLPIEGGRSDFRHFFSSHRFLTLVFSLTINRAKRWPRVDNMIDSDTARRLGDTKKSGSREGSRCARGGGNCLRDKFLPFEISNAQGRVEFRRISLPGGSASVSCVNVASFSPAFRGLAAVLTYCSRVLRAWS
jgi:hypothetical protein